MPRSQPLVANSERIGTYVSSPPSSEMVKYTSSRLLHFWKFQIIVWSAFALLTLPAKLEVSMTFYSVLGSYGLRDGFAVALTCLMRKIYDHVFQRHYEIPRMVGMVLAVSSSAGVLQLILFFLVGEIFPFEEKTWFAHAVPLGIFYYRTGLFACWSFLYLNLVLEEEKRDREARLAETELRMLRALINSHFMFNALNTILVTIERKAEGGTKMVQALADYLNYSLRHKNDDLVSLGEESGALKDYLVLEQARFGSNLDLAWQIDDSLRDLRVPGIILQPLVENAIKFGFETWTPPVVVRLGVTRGGSNLVFEIANTGHWVKPDPERQTGGIGLDNIRERLALLYPNSHSMDVVSEEGWVSVRIRIPVKS